MSLCVFVVIKSLSLVQFFCDSIDYSQPDSAVHGISEARVLKWIAIPFFGESS